jgi:hypothetical protein
LTEEIKLIFDECLSAPVVEALRPFLERSGVSLKTKSVVEIQKAGTADSVWIPKVALEGGWIVISSDRGKSKREKFDEKLPYLCRLHRITHVLLSARVHDLKLFEKGQAVVAVWQDLLKVRDVTAGARFMLKKRDHSDGFQLVNSDLKAELVIKTIEPTKKPMSQGSLPFAQTRRRVDIPKPRLENKPDKKEQ